MRPVPDPSANAPSPLADPTNMSVTKEQVLAQLSTINDPDLNRDIVSLGFVTKAAVCDGVVDVVINLTTPACPVKDQLKQEAIDKISALEGANTVNVEMTAEVRGTQEKRELSPDIKHIVAVSSGKGGVGKSTVTVNLACALAKTGAKVGILDCDVYGPDIPMMFGMTGQPDQEGQKLVPKERHGVKTMSIGYLLDEEKPVIWRGPMVHKLIEQFLGDVMWGELDYLLVDMPPGTGDAQLSLAQIVPLSGAVLVTTPQAVSTFDVGKAISMFKQVKVEILGIVENMAGYSIGGKVDGASEGASVDLDLGDRSVTVTTDADGRFEATAHVFGQGGAQRLAQRHGFPVIGSVPLNPSVRVGGDAGDPVTIAAPDSLIAKRFEEIAGKVAQQVAIRAFSSLPILD